MANTISSYFKLVEFLGITLGPDYEVVLYDLHNIDKGIVAIANGHVSGRSLGSPLSVKHLDALERQDLQSIDYDTNYNALAGNNKLLRSSTLYIKDDGKIVGLLCINFDDSKYKDISRTIMELCHPNELITKNAFESIDEIELSYESDSLGMTVDDIAMSAIKKVMGNLQIGEKLTKKDRMSVVAAMHEKGIFNLKGSVSLVAKELSCSEATIYRYIQNLDTTI